MAILVHQITEFSADKNKRTLKSKEAWESNLFEAVAPKEGKSFTEKELQDLLGATEEFPTIVCAELKHPEYFYDSEHKYLVYVLNKHLSYNNFIHVKYTLNGKTVEKDTFDEGKNALIESLIALYEDNKTDNVREFAHNTLWGYTKGRYWKSLAKSCQNDFVDKFSTSPDVMLCTEEEYQLGNFLKGPDYDDLVDKYVKEGEEAHKKNKNNDILADLIWFYKPKTHLNAKRLNKNK